MFELAALPLDFELDAFSAELFRDAELDGLVIVAHHHYGIDDERLLGGAFRFESLFEFGVRRGGNAQRRE